MNRSTTTISRTSCCQRATSIQAATEEAIALRLAPDDLSVDEIMGRKLFHQANYAGALQQFSHAVELGADKAAVATAINDMGASVASRGQPREAEPLIRKAVQSKPPGRSGNTRI